MKKFVIAGVSILAVFLLVLSCQTSVVGYRVVRDSQEKLIQQTINKVKTNLLILKSLIPTGKQTTGIFGTIYLGMAFIVFIILFLFAVFLLFFNTDYPITFSLFLLLLSSPISMLLSALWPLVILWVIYWLRHPYFPGRHFHRPFTNTDTLTE